MKLTTTLKPESKVLELVQPVQMNIHQISIYIKDLNWLCFITESGVQGRQQEKDQQSYIPISISYLTFSSNS